MLSGVVITIYNKRVITNQIVILICGQPVNYFNFVENCS